MKQRLRELLARSRLILASGSREERQSLIATLRALKENMSPGDDLPIPFRQRGLTAFIREIDEYTKKPTYSEKDDEDLTKSINKYLTYEPFKRRKESGEGAGAGAGEKVEEMVEVKEEDDPDEEKEEEKEEVKVDEGDALEMTKLKRQESEKKLESTIDEIGKMSGTDGDEPLSTPMSSPPPTRPPSPMSSPPPTPPPSPMSSPPPTPPPSPMSSPPPTPTTREEPEEKSLEDISTEQVIEIPSERKGTDGKSMTQLDGDIKFFLSKYPSLLKQEAAFYKKMKKTKRNLVELHRRIEAKLAPVEKKPQTIGVIVDADKYIDERIKALLVEKTMTNLKPADMVVDVSEPEDKSLMRKGSYVLSKGRAGRLAIERSPVYRNIPTTNPQPRPRPYQDVKMLKSQRWDLTNTAKKHVLEDPFIAKQPVKRINLLL
jgi:hypothetical protein